MIYCLNAVRCVCFSTPVTYSLRFSTLVAWPVSAYKRTYNSTCRVGGARCSKHGGVSLGLMKATAPQSVVICIALPLSPSLWQSLSPRASFYGWVSFRLRRPPWLSSDSPNCACATLRSNNPKVTGISKNLNYEPPKVYAQVKTQYMYVIENSPSTVYTGIKILGGYKRDKYSQAR